MVGHTSSELYSGFQSVQNTGSLLMVVQEVQCFCVINFLQAYNQARQLSLVYVVVVSKALIRKEKTQNPCFMITTFSITVYV